MTLKTPTARQLARLAVQAYRKRTDQTFRGDSAGSPSESFNRPLLNQIRQARSLLFNMGPAPPYEIPAQERWAMRGTELKVRRSLYPTKETL